MEQRKKRTKMSQSSKIMLSSVFCGVLLIIAMFILLGVNVNIKSTSAINDIGQMFMSGMGRQTTLRYDAVLEQRTTMVNGLYKLWDPASPTVNNDLKEAAKARDFTHLAYMDEDGNFEMLLGDELELDDKERFPQTLVAE